METSGDGGREEVWRGEVRRPEREKEVCVVVVLGSERRVGRRSKRERRKEIGVCCAALYFAGEGEFWWLHRSRLNGEGGEAKIWGQMEAVDQISRNPWANIHQKSRKS
ncbi:hypothetical protein HAX54_045541 [Datura stramonium]|uniref:Uncharacterized protein n=1 Tax=Datura stramonium TaxID=4076 RepID=A0ABS8WI17_DATST|nr:hypothetical protein [Datura stramonium]